MDKKKNKTPALQVTQAQVIEKVSDYYLLNFNPLPDEQTCTSELLKLLNDEFDLYNAVLAPGKKFKLLTDIPDRVVAKLITHRDDVALLGTGSNRKHGIKKGYTAEDKKKLPFVFYQSDGWNEGVWVIANSYDGLFGELVERYKPSATIKEKKEIFEFARTMARVVERCSIPYYVAVNNGIADVLNHQLLPFSKDIVFTMKIHTDLNPNATNPFIPVASEPTGYWDVESWFNEFGSPDFVNNIKEVIQAACLPYVPRDQMVLWYNTVGCNGKTTLAQLIRNIIGEDYCANICMADFKNRQELLKLTEALAIITDDNPVGEEIPPTAVAILKSVVTGDIVSIKRLYQNPFDYRFQGLVLQNVNALPYSRDFTGSFKRRLHVMEFSKSFIKEDKKFIKSEMIYRKDVLEYVLKMVLIDMDYRETFTNTAETEKYYPIHDNDTTLQSVGDSVFEFLDEVLPTSVWNLLPLRTLLYEAFKKWCNDNNLTITISSYNSFFKSVKEYIDLKLKEDVNFEWEWSSSVRTSNYIDFTQVEPLVDKYHIDPFYTYQDPQASANDKAYFGNQIIEKYSGLKRRNCVITMKGNDEE